MPSKPHKKTTDTISLGGNSSQRWVLLVIFSFIAGFMAHILFTVIFAETKEDGKIHACVKRGGEIRIVTDHKEYREGKREKERRNNKEDTNGCRENETALEWNIQGPPGPPGNSNGGSNSQIPFICAGCSIGNAIGDRLVGKDLSNAVLFDTTLQGANLKDVNFTNANISQATLSKANLENVNLENATLLGTDVEGVNWSGVKWKNTICPDGTNSNDNNGTCEGHFNVD